MQLSQPDSGNVAKLNKWRKSVSFTTLIFINMLLFELVKPSQAIAESETLEINGNVNATEHRGQIYQEFRYNCLPGQTIGSAWGTDIYTDDSSICQAATHAGIITESGGLVIIKILPGKASYTGTFRHGVQTQDWGNWYGSFIFVNQGSGEPISNPEIPLIDGNINATDHQNQIGQEFTYCCLPNSLIGNVWGTNIYTVDSSICTAAIHRGIIDQTTGGTVTIRIIPGRSAYRSSTRHGIKSHEWGSYPSSFVFMR